MARYKVINRAGDYRTDQDVRNVLNYVTSPGKISAGSVLGGAVLPELAADMMECVTDVFHNAEGLRLRHSVLSFSPDEGLSLEAVKAIARDCLSFYEDDYQIISAVHEDREHLHIHFVMNTTNYNTGSKYCGTKKDYYDFLGHIDAHLIPYGTHVESGK